MSIKNNNTNSTKKALSKFRINKNLVLGAPDAETDQFLNDCFWDNGAYEVLRNPSASKCIVIGRTGSGKSALIKRLVEHETHVKRIEPESMSLKYLSNSTILNYLRSLDVNLNFFYKVLWKHVFIVEILKLYIGEEDTKRSSFFQKITSLSRHSKKNIAKQKAIEYLKNWTDEFWLKTEHRVRELSEQLQERIEAEIGSQLSFVSSKASSIESISSEKKIEIKHKAERIISDIQADELYDLIELLKEEIFYDTQKKYFIVVDDLDKDWVSPQIVYDLIAAMIEIIKEFQEKFKGVKIVVAMRDNLHNLVFSGKQHRGGQREKYSSLYMHLNWSKDDLKGLIDLRIQELSQRQLNVETIFERKKNSYKSGFEYIVERTFYRPRDVISFFNKLIENIDKKNQYFNTDIIKHAETYYSIERFEAIQDEWEENYGDINKICSFLYAIHNGFNIINIKEDKFAEIIVEPTYIDNFKGELFEICHKWRSSNTKPSDFKDFISELLFILFRIGVIGIKKKPQEPVCFYYNKTINVTPIDFDSNVKIYVHKSLYSYFKINVKEQEGDYYG